MQIYWLVALVFGIVIALFAVQNSTPVPISLLWFRAEGVAVSVLVLVCAALGALVTLLFGVGRELKLRMARRSSRQTTQSQEQRIADLEASVQRLEQEKADLQAKLGSQPNPPTPLPEGKGESSQPAPPSL
ncbi:MAG TPA: lipopolysaccharide assembly protein LapA domain-containing protein [Chloroflexota bacterium]|nr:lipopolysaccharide assembly protein LapA domain-containing protein [Chloroflexota bacterium]